MKIMEYLKNPVGKGSAIYPLKDMIAKYDAKYDAAKNNITHKIYTFRGMIYYHITVPSKEDNIKYDVLVEFRRNNRSTDRSILDMSFRVFSNCPSFVYTYAYAYNKQKIVIDTLQRSVTRKAIQDKAAIRNRYNVVGFEYSVYLAFKHLVSNKIHSMDYINNNSERLLLLDGLYRKMQDFDSLMIRRKAADKNRRERQRREGNEMRKANKSRRLSSNRKSQEVERVDDVRSVSVVKTTKTNKRARSTKSTKTTKKK